MIFLILDGIDGKLLVRYSSDNASFDDKMESGLISTLSNSNIAEFNKPTLSFNMGGFKWIYNLDPESNILYIISDSIEETTELMQGRLNFLKKLFMKRHVPNASTWRENWSGDIENLQSFTSTIDEYHKQWSTAGDINSIAEFYDSMGIFQEFLNMVQSIIEQEFLGDSKKEIYAQMDKIIAEFKELEEVKKEPELLNLHFSELEGCNVFELNPLNGNGKEIIKLVKIFIKSIGMFIKKELGQKSCLYYFSEEGMFDYCINNMKLIKKLHLDLFMIKLILISSK